MNTPNFRSAFEAMGEAEILAARGNEELARLVVRSISRGLRALVGRFRRPRPGRSFI